MGAAMVPPGRGVGRCPLACAADTAGKLKDLDKCFAMGRTYP
jgi:hypothetical protein